MTMTDDDADDDR